MLQDTILAMANMEGEEKCSRLSDSHSTLHDQDNGLSKQNVASNKEDIGSHSPSIVHSSSHVSSTDDLEAQRVEPTVAIDLGNAGKVKRRGFLSKFVLLPEVEEPEDYPPKIKWTITAIIAMAGSVAPLGSSIILR